jgi:hypothetical protein
MQSPCTSFDDGGQHLSHRGTGDQPFPDFIGDSTRAHQRQSKPSRSEREGLKTQQDVANPRIEA